MDLIADGILRELIANVRSSSTTVKIIVTCRKKGEATPTGIVQDRAAGLAITIEKKVAILREAIDLGADFVDIELAEGSAAIKKIFTYCKKKVILLQ